MDKLLIEVAVPALGCTLEVRMPLGLTFAQAARLCLALAAQQTGAPAPAGPGDLFRMDGAAYDPAQCIQDSDLRSGMRLVLL